ncbi:MAG: hypothetical protein KDD34_01935 [Bdellovibrionales bacterium]|nr:hypothetical protein [Bdellovibrionales bacterium]
MVQKAVFICIFFLVGCASWGGGVRLVDIDKPLTHIKSAVLSSVPLGIRKTEKSGLEIYSKYFRPGGRKFIPSHSWPERYFAHILIRGDRRPYTIEIYVYKEKKAAVSEQSINGYVQVGQDERLAKLIRERVKEQLTKRREDPNIIDDFRVF